ncbi:hypothetical protein [Haloglomus irregulare]|jgi:hypothetical protein|uniref:hypothetical protein n=1 Tax=Haloglomus irregulare TaxID=2234134 RepID=UPI0011858509|nr:hypothetical protein [Haloglomus irregulare]
MSSNVEVFTDQRGYTKIKDPESGSIVYLHHLNAIVDHSIKEIARDDVEVHHDLGFPSDAGVRVDAPDTLTPVHRTIHRRLHADDDASVDPGDAFTKTAPVSGD